MEEPPPVNLVSVEDVRRSTRPGLVEQLDQFYCGLWEFTKEDLLVYRAENFRLRFTEVLDQNPIERDAIRPQGILVHSLRDAEKKLVEAEREYFRQRGLGAGQYSLLCRDPAGNWVELFDAVPVG